MENASKALLIAGGVLLTLLVVSLLIFAWGKYSDFYNNQDELSEISDIRAFNSQFTAFEKRDVHGYELISLCNKIADYNMRYSNAAGSQNDERYNRITMTINLDGKSEVLKHSGETSVRPPLFTRDIYTTDGIINIIETATGIERAYGGSDTTTKLAKSIDSLVLTNDQIEYNKTYRGISESESKNTALSKYNSIVKINKATTYEEMNSKILGDADIMKYYEFYQFKRGIFRCETINPNTDYDNVSGRISKISFTFTGKIE